MHPPDDELESKTTAALAEYANPSESPSPALVAARVLAAARAKHNAGWRCWTAAYLLTAATVLFVISTATYFWRTPLHPASHPALYTTAFPPHALPTPPSPSRLFHVERNQRNVASHTKTAAPKLDQFPQPKPLTEQEKLLRAFVSTASPQNQQLVARAAQPPDFMRPAELDNPPQNNPENTQGAPHEQPR